MTVFQRYMRAFVWVVLRLIYRVRVENADQIPQRGPVVLAPNHVSYLDAVLIAAHTSRPVRYAMHWRLYRRFRWIVAPMGAFPIAGKSENIAIYNEAFAIMANTLRRGEVLCLFPEGRITTDGQLGEFRHGLRKLLDGVPAIVVPIGLNNLWGSYFSKKKTGVFKLPEHFMARITMRIGHPLPAEVSMSELHRRVGALLQ